MSRTRHLADRRDRERAESDLDRSFMVEAAAGTGKTTLLVSRILRLLKTGKARPEEIVAITFTDRAAAELKAKLQERLGGATAESSGEEARRLADALWGLDRMQVTTIHAFCTSILKERPVEAGIDPSFAVADELAASLLAQETWDEWIASEMDRRNPVMARALGIGITLDTMHGLALEISANRDVTDYLPQPEACDADLAGFVTDFRETTARLEEAAGLCTDTEDKLLPLIEDLRKHAHELGAIDSEAGCRAYIFKGMTIRSGRNLGKVSNWVSKENLKEVREAIGTLRDRHKEVKTRIAHETIALLAQELLAFVGAYTKAKASHGLLDFHDLLLCARDLLKQHAHVRDYFRRRFRFMLVDEFQDTDPLQAEIIFYLAGETAGGTDAWEDVRVTPGKLFLVGDPKQSIYRFRRADIEMYASAKHLVGRDRHLSIHQNFRCADSIISVVNEIFEDLIKVPEDGNYQPEYVAVDFGRPEATLPARHGAVILYPPESAVMDSADLRRICESRSIAALIRSVIGDREWKIWDRTEERLRPLMLRDIAILMRTQTGLDILEQALRLYDIGYRVVGGKRFFLCEEIQHLLAVLMSIDNPNDRVSLVAALRSPFFGISDEEIFVYHAGGGVLSYLSKAEGTPLEQAFDLFHRLHDIRNKVDAVTLLNTLYEETKAPVIFLLRPNGEQRVANLLKIGDIARALADRGMLTFRAFVRWLAERKDEEAEEAEAATVESGDDFIRLLTIHKAKGLEFPVVILTDLASRRPGGERFIVDRRSKEIAISLGSKDHGMQTVNYADLSQYEDLRREAEERRMLYVAMTRARDLLVIPAYFTKGDPPPGSLLGYLAGKIPPPGTPDVKTKIKGMHVFDNSILDLQQPERPTFRIPIDPDAPESPEAEASYRRFKVWKEKRARTIENFNCGRNLRAATEEKDIPAGTGPGDGPVFGKIVHTILERVDWAKPDSLDEIASREAATEGADASMARRAADMVRQALASDLVRRITSADRYYKEVPFVFKEDGTIVEGVIDVLFEEDGGIGVVDFKTDNIPKSAVAERAETYRDQMETYRMAVSQACGRSPDEVILFFLHLMEAVVVPPREAPK
jgi:ATP-dependent helicase/nuclease subunit A